MTRDCHGIFGILVMETLAMQESTTEMKVNFWLLLQFLLFLVLILLRANRRRKRQYFHCVNENTAFYFFMMCESILVIMFHFLKGTVYPSCTKKNTLKSNSFDVGKTVFFSYTYKFGLYY